MTHVVVSVTFTANSLYTQAIFAILSWTLLEHLSYWTLIHLTVAASNLTMNNHYSQYTQNSGGEYSRTTTITLGNGGNTRTSNWDRGRGRGDFGCGHLSIKCVENLVIQHWIYITILTIILKILLKLTKLLLSLVNWFLILHGLWTVEPQTMWLLSWEICNNMLSIMGWKS